MSITTVYARAVPFPPVLYCTKYSVLRPCGFLVPCSSPGGGGFRHDKLPPFRWGHVTLEHSTGLERFLNPQQTVKASTVQFRQDVKPSFISTQPSNITGSSSSTMRISHVLAEQYFLPANSYPHGPDPASQQPYGGKGTKTNKLNIPTAYSHQHDSSSLRRNYTASYTVGPEMISPCDQCPIMLLGIPP